MFLAQCGAGTYGPRPLFAATVMQQMQSAQCRNVVVALMARFDGTSASGGVPLAGDIFANE